MIADKERLGERLEDPGLALALASKTVDRFLAKPWDHNQLYRITKDLLSAFLLQHAFDQVEHYENIVSHTHYRQALVNKERQRASLELQRESLARNLWTLQQSFLAPDRFSDEELRNKLYTELLHLSETKDVEGVFETFADGTVILQEGAEISHMRLVKSGWVVHVRQELKQAGVDELMTEGPGALIGSTAHYGGGGKAFTSVIAKGPVDVVNVTRDVLERAMAKSFNFTIYFANVLFRQVNRRVRLNIAGQARLATTLAELQAAQVQLVESEKMASLGQLVAGIAHELNNPTAAILSSVEHLAEGLVSLMGGAMGRVRPPGKGRRAAVGSRPLNVGFA